jgi:hypothetical protein
VHHGQQVCRNVKDDARDQPSERLLGAERRALLDSTSAAWTPPIYPERCAGHYKAAGSA